MSDEVAAAVAAIGGAASLQVTAPGHTDAEALPPVKFDRLSLERRVLGHITDEKFHEAFGSRNTLAGLAFALMHDRNSTHPPATHGRLEVDGKSTEEIVQSVLEHLGRLVDAGLVEQRDDGSYAVTEAGRKELQS